MASAGETTHDPDAATTLGRRQLLAGGLAGLAGAAGGVALGGSAAAAGRAEPVPGAGGAGDVRTGHGEPLRVDPFRLGVASGDPLPHAVVLWTRLVRDVLDAGSLPYRPIRVEWAVARDRRFRQVVRRGVATARPELAHSVHVDVRGLQPARDYYYRFRAGGHLSDVGRTRTAPAPGARLGHVRVGIANCQDFQNGYWPAYRGLADEDLDVVLHLGDYIYEYDPDSAYADRRHNPSQVAGLDQLRVLSDYRNRHALYKTDVALQAAHAAFPWIVTWDDHETENDYADLLDEDGDAGARRQDPAQFARQRAAAYQAYYEHLPLRPRPRLGSPDYTIYRSFDFGDLVSVNVLDTRQYRTDQPGAFGAEEAGEANVDGTLTGAEQYRWLRRNLRRSDARWNVLAQQVMMARTRFPRPAGSVPPFVVNLDQWDGYAPHRARLLRMLDREGVRNPVVLAGDIHSSWFSDLKRDFDDPASRTVAVEFTATSISSDFPIAFDAPIKAANPRLNPHVRYFDGSRRGYLRCDITRERWRTDARTVPTIAVPVAPVSTTASYVTVAGRPGVVPA